MVVRGYRGPTGRWAFVSGYPGLQPGLSHCEPSALKSLEGEGHWVIASNRVCRFVTVALASDVATRGVAPLYPGLDQAVPSGYKPGNAGLGAV